MRRKRDRVRGQMRWHHNWQPWAATGQSAIKQKSYYSFSQAQSEISPSQSQPLLTLKWLVLKLLNNAWLFKILSPPHPPVQDRYNLIFPSNDNNKNQNLPCVWNAKTIGQTPGYFLLSFQLFIWDNRLQQGLDCNSFKKKKKVNFTKSQTFN